MMTSRLRSRVSTRSGSGTLPNLIIIGAQKCATTSLHYYLSLHPEVSMSQEKELNFFISEYNWYKGVPWYKSHFTGKERVHGESSTGYTNYPIFKGVPERMHSEVPDAKLIYILRDPIDRMLSHYMHRYCVGREDRDISEAFRNGESNPYVCRSKYFMQLAQYLRFFSKSNILIITAESLYHKRLKTLKQVFRFLNIDDSFHSGRFFFMWHKSSHKRRRTPCGLRLESLPIMNVMRLLPFEMRGALEKMIYFPFSRRVKGPQLDEGLLQECISFIKEDVELLRKLTGCGFERWRG